MKTEELDARQGIIKCFAFTSVLKRRFGSRSQLQLRLLLSTSAEASLALDISRVEPYLSVEAEMKAGLIESGETKDTLNQRAPIITLFLEDCPGPVLQGHTHTHTHTLC